MGLVGEVGHPFRGQQVALLDEAVERMLVPFRCRETAVSARRRGRGGTILAQELHPQVHLLLVQAVLHRDELGGVVDHLVPGAGHRVGRILRRQAAAHGVDELLHPLLIGLGQIGKKAVQRVGGFLAHWFSFESGKTIKHHPALHAGCFLAGTVGRWLRLYHRFMTKHSALLLQRRNIVAGSQTPCQPRQGQPSGRGVRMMATV
ncbi:hypothetical protein D3C85_1294610 [compost metagenome]